MSISQSNLSSTGFDYVVAVTSASINATMEAYLYGGLQEATLCYVYDATNNPTAIDYQTFLNNNGNPLPEPFSIPNGTSTSDPRVQSLGNANFAFAIKAKLGYPYKWANPRLQNIITLNPGQSDINYSLMFSEFIATELVRDPAAWFSEAQINTAWTFGGLVDLNFQDATFTDLPDTVQNQLKDLQNQGATFSIQQLYYDLNSRELEMFLRFVNIPSNSALNTFMANDFVSVYWEALGAHTILGYTANQTSPVSSSTLAVTDLNFFTPDAVGDEGAPLTLNYLCATNNNPLADTSHAEFGWNWIDLGEALQYDGAAALNRNTFAKYFDEQLRPYVPKNCFSPAGQIRCWLTGDFKTHVNYSWGLTGGQEPTVSFPESGDTVLTYSYASATEADQAGLNGDLGRLAMSSSFNLSVSFEGNTIVIVQHLIVWCYIRHAATSTEGNIVDKQITDTYSIGIDDQGKIVASLQHSDTVDNSQTLSANAFLNFWAPVNTPAADVSRWAQNCIGTKLTNIPVSVVQSFVFPGGSTFLFSDVSFSDNQDLVSHITYAEAS